MQIARRELERLIRSAFISGYACGTDDDGGIYDDEGRVRTTPSSWEQRARAEWRKEKHHHLPKREPKPEAGPASMILEPGVITDEEVEDRYNARRCS